MSLTAIFFGIFTVIALMGAIGVVALRSPVRSAVSLIASLLGVAGLFLLQQAEFLFAVQVVLYVGGIMLLFIFLIMLVDLESFAGQRKFVKGWIFGVLAVLSLGVPLLWLLMRVGPFAQVATTGSVNTSIAVGRSNVEKLADDLLLNQSASFELVSVLLLTAMIGAVYAARRRNQ
jgi:NADH-quinone oxidoreductase subunit J